MDMRSKNTGAYRIAPLFPIAAGVGWGVVGVFIRMLKDEGLDDPTIIFTRTCVGLIIASAVLGMFRRDAFRIRKRDFPLFIANTLVGSIGLMLAYNVAVEELSLSLAAIIMASAPAFVLVISILIFNEKATVKKILCLAGAFLGCAMLSGVFETTDLNWSRIGMIMGILSMVFNGGWILISKEITNRGYGSYTVCFYSFLLATLILAPFVDWGALTSYIISKPVESAAVLFVQSLCTSIIPTSAYIIGLRYLDAGKTAILEGGSEPSAALVIGILVYSEIPSVVGFAGIAITIVALGILAAEEHKP